MRNTELVKLAKVFNDIIEKDDKVCEIFDNIADALIDDDDVRAWFYDRAGIIRPENYDGHSIS